MVPNDCCTDIYLAPGTLPPPGVALFADTKTLITQQPGSVPTTLISLESTRNGLSTSFDIEER